MAIYDNSRFDLDNDFEIIDSSNENEIDDILPDILPCTLPDIQPLDSSFKGKSEQVKIKKTVSYDFISQVF